MQNAAEVHSITMKHESIIINRMVAILTDRDPQVAGINPNGGLGVGLGITSSLVSRG